MTYRELIIKLLKQHPDVLDQSVLIHNEEDERFYGCTGHDITTNDDVPSSNKNKLGMDIGQFFLMVNI